MPYLIRYNNFQQISNAIDEALIMDRSYTPGDDLASWDTVTQEFLHEMSNIEPPVNQQL